MPGHDLLPGFHLGNPLHSSGGSANENGSGNAGDGNVGETGVLTNPDSIETKRVQQELVERAMVGDVARSGVPVHVSPRPNNAFEIILLTSRERRLTPMRRLCRRLRRQQQADGSLALESQVSER
jgi:hypothetical protein